MNLILYSTIFVLGLVVGSFLNSVVYRFSVPETENQSPFLGRSYCPNCRHTLSWPDLIPLFSFLVLGGKCRHCSQKISLQYPLVEIATGAIFFLIYFYNSVYSLQLTAYSLIVVSFLIVIFVYDLKHYIIPDKVIYPAIGIALVYNVLGFARSDLFGRSDLLSLGLGILPSLFFLAIILLSKGRWMGMGDFKLAILMGLFLGWPNILVALFLAFFSGAIMGLAMISFKKKTLRSEVPFGPFLVAGTFVAMIWGQELIKLYFKYAIPIY